MQYSTNYHFKLPEPSDFVNVNDLSENFGSIDTLLKNIADSRAKIAVGSYVGTGTTGASSPNVISVGFKPKLVIISRHNLSSSYDGYIGIYVDGTGTVRTYGGVVYGKGNVATADSNGLSWYYEPYASGREEIQLNSMIYRYSYVAIG